MNKNKSKFLLLVILIFTSLSISLNSQSEDKGETNILFKNKNPIKIGMYTDWKRIQRKKRIRNPDERPYTKGSLVHFRNGENHNYVVNIRARGWGRLVNCDIPPIKVKRIKPTEENSDIHHLINSTGTMFEGTKSLKLVTRCDDEKKKRWVRIEHVIYQLYSLLTPYSFKTKGMDLTIRQRKEKYLTRLKGKAVERHYGFIIESAKGFAKRHSFKRMKEDNFSKKDLRPYDLNLMLLFGFMIGNHDIEISQDEVRNAKIFEVSEGVYLPAPYDFDWAEIVREKRINYTPSYAHHLCSMTDSLFQKIKNVFFQKKNGMIALINNSDIIDKDEKEKMVNHIHDFMNKLNEPDYKKFLFRKGARSCR